MNAKSLLIVGVLTLSSLGIASAKSYTITLSEPVMAGTTQLKPGQYNVKLKGNQAVLTNTEGDKPVTVNVHVAQSDKKFDQTAVETTKNNGMDSIKSINLGGSTTMLQLGE
jgi:predicted component of type VI protein secretion system